MPSRWISPMIFFSCCIPLLSFVSVCYSLFTFFLFFFFPLANKECQPNEIHWPTIFLPFVELWMCVSLVNVSSLNDKHYMNCFMGHTLQLCRCQRRKTNASAYKSSDELKNGTFRITCWGRNNLWAVVISFFLFLTTRLTCKKHNIYETFSAQTKATTLTDGIETHGETASVRETEPHDLGAIRRE